MKIRKWLWGLIFAEALIIIVHALIPFVFDLGYSASEFYGKYSDSIQGILLFEVVFAGIAFWSMRKEPASKKERTLWSLALVEGILSAIYVIIPVIRYIKYPVHEFSALTEQFFGRTFAIATVFGLLFLAESTAALIDLRRRKCSGAG